MESFSIYHCWTCNNFNGDSIHIKAKIAAWALHGFKLHQKIVRRNRCLWLPQRIAFAFEWHWDISSFIACIEQPGCWHWATIVSTLFQVRLKVLLTSRDCGNRIKKQVFYSVFPDHYRAALDAFCNNTLKCFGFSGSHTQLNWVCAQLFHWASTMHVESWSNSMPQ